MEIAEDRHAHPSRCPGYRHTVVEDKAAVEEGISQSDGVRAHRSDDISPWGEVLRSGWNRCSDETKIEHNAGDSYPLLSVFVAPIQNATLMSAL